MQVGGSGGGYFYGPFVSTQEFREFQMVPDPLAAVYGAWSHLPAPIPTGRGRWLEMSVWVDGYGATYSVQIGLGALGSEIVFQPSDGLGFYIDWFGPMLWTIPFRISFPTSVGLNKEFCIRCSSVPGGGPTLHAMIWLWN